MKSITALSVDEIWNELSEKTDRTSPQECPDMILITKDELAAYISAASPAFPEVRPLVWRHIEGVANKIEHWRAVSITGDYFIDRGKKGFDWFAKSDGGVNSCATLTDAMNAAQAHFQARILSALSSTSRTTGGQT